MPHDPRARVVDVGKFRPYNHPQYGPGAIREVEYEDGTIEQRFFYHGTQQEGQGSPEEGFPVPELERINAQAATSWRSGQGRQTPEEQERARQIVEEGKRKSVREERDEAERQRNLADPDYRMADTNAERAAREAKEAADRRAEEAADRQQRAEARQAETSALNARIAQQNYDLSAAKFEAEQREPKFLSQAGQDNPYLVRYNPESGQVEQMSNPNYDAAKVQAERLRQQLATQIQARQITLDEAKQTYTQWFDTNVKIPLMQSQEARDRAAEQRAALDAEERRRQFAANFGLQKAELGERAGEAAMSAEQSLLPYRAGPTESAEMSSAINSLASGGSMANNASAGINFTPEAFQFDAPNFKKIASEAAKNALKGLTDYRPAEGKYQTADYSGVPSVNASGAPEIPSGYGQFQDIIDQMKSTYNYGGQ